MTFILFIFTLFIYVSLCQNEQKLTLLDNFCNSCKCLDSSSSGYYYRPNATSNKWVIFLQGGGFCATKEECTSRSKSDLGSSKSWSSSRTGSGIQSIDAKVNPDFYDANQIYVPYCCGDLHSGTRTNVSDETFGLWFTGHNTVQAVVDHLQIHSSLKDSAETEVILTGGSAGGIGTFVNADWLTQKLPNSRVVGVPDAGWFISARSFLNESFIPVDYIASIGKPLWKGYVNQDCEKYDLEKNFLCYSAPYLYPFVKTPLFIVECNYDTNQIFVQNQTPEKNSTEVWDYVLYFGGAMKETLDKVKKSDGLFNPYCLTHVVDFSNTFIGGKNYQESLSQWYHNPGVEVHLRDNCDNPCNPSCGL